MRDVVKVGLLILACLIILVPYSPALSPTHNDSGVFAYMGQQILEGKLPYRDTWDHKPPLIHYINAVGLVIGNGTLWGVWLIQLGAIFGAALLSYGMLSRSFNAFIGLIGTLLWLVALPAVIDGGNLTEIYSIPLQFAAIYLFLYRTDNRAWFASGILLGLLILLRPNHIGIHFAIMISLLIRRNLIAIVYIASGAAIVLALVALYFLINNALPQAIDTIIGYNRVYADTGHGLLHRIESIIYGIQLLDYSRIAFFSIIGWLVALTKKQEPLALLAVIALPIEFTLMFISTRRYPHYYMIWIPTFAILSSMAYCEIESTLRRFAKGRTRNFGNAWAGIVRLSLVSMILIPLAGHATNIALQQPPTAQINAVNLINKHTADDKYLLMWGTATQYNVLSGKRSPTKYVYQNALFECNYVTPEMVREFRQSVESTRPVIVDTLTTAPSLGNRHRSNPFTGCIIPEMESTIAFIKDNYVQVDSIPYLDTQWIIYKFKDS